MNKQIALAYGVAGLAVAIAFVTVVATTLGFSESPATPEPVAAAAPVAAPVADLPSQRNAAEAEVLYVDERGNPVDPRVALASTGGWRDDDDDHDDDHDDDDHDDDHHRRGRGDRDDD